MIFWVVAAVVAVIVQIVKSRGEQAPKPQGPSTGSDEPGDELRRFLESLGGETVQPTRPAPPPPVPMTPPPPPVHATPASQVLPERHRPRVIEKPRPVNVRPAPMRPALAVQSDAYTPSAAALAVSREVRERTGLLGKEIGGEFDSLRHDVDRLAAQKAFRMSMLADLRNRDRKPIQKAIVLSELLGTPVGLRQAAQVPGAVRY